MGKNTSRYRTKKALTIIEVLISILLITIVIGSLLQIKSNNLHIIEKSDENSLYKSYISLFALDYIKAENRNLKHDITKSLTIVEDSIKNHLEVSNIVIKDKEIKEENELETLVSFQVIESTYSVKDKVERKFYKVINIQ